PLKYLVPNGFPYTRSPLGVSTKVSGLPSSPQYRMVVFNRVSSPRSVKKSTISCEGGTQPAPEMALPRWLPAGPCQRKKVPQSTPGRTISPVGRPKSEYCNSNSDSSHNLPGSLNSW